MADPTERYPHWYLHRWHFLPEGYLSQRSVGIYQRLVPKLYYAGQEARVLVFVHVTRRPTEGLAEEAAREDQAHRIHEGEARERVGLEGFPRMGSLEARSARRFELGASSVRDAVLRREEAGELRARAVGSERRVFDGQTEEARTAERLDAFALRLEGSHEDL